MVNFDNSATSYPKPDSVLRTISSAMAKYGGNPGRSGHRLSIDTAEAVYAARQTAAGFFGAETDNTVFTLNCTHALNTAIKGIMTGGGHIIISDLEHNSAARPVYALSKKGCSFSIAAVAHEDEETLRSFERQIRPDTKAVVCTLGSNVTGQIPPYKAIAELCRRRGICFIADGAQACGVSDIKLSDGINILCTAGHKSLYGPPGTGLLVTDGTFRIEPLTEGGTGSSSLELQMPDFLPDALESGTVNTAGIIALEEGIKFVEKIGTEKIYKHENSLCEHLIEGFSGLKGVTFYREKGNYLPIVSFNIDGYTSNEAAEILSEKGYALRGGLHCSGLAHTSLGTAPEGTVRFSPSVFNTVQQVDGLLNVINDMLKKSKIS